MLRGWPAMTDAAAEDNVAQHNLKGSPWFSSMNTARESSTPSAQ